VDLSELKDILRILEEQDITEFELEHDGVKLRVCRSGPPGQPASHPGPGLVGGVSPVVVGGGEPPRAPEGLGTSAGVPTSQGEPEAEGDSAVSSPIVGTFYRAPDPNSAPFVSVGDRVRVGQVLCIIEAMKLMNEIEAEVAGEVVKIHPENGQPVQFGDPLFTIRPA
jgi:acetyl-CoA carboxylase biotin carboxyl carrier protein